MGKKLNTYDKRLNKVRYFRDYNHAARKLLKFKRQHVARAFSASCFKYIRYILFVLGSLLAVSYFDIPVIESETQIAISFVNLVVLYLILTFALYCLSFLYFPLCKMISYIKQIGDEDPYKSTGNMTEDTKRLYIASEKLEKEANHLWSTWWHALYVKRSRILKILTAICCGGVLFLKGYFCVESDIHAVFEKYHLFAGSMSTSDVVVLSAIGIAFVLVVYFVQWLAFYLSDRMILATQFRNSAVWFYTKYAERLREYWREHDEEERARYWAEVEKSVKEREWRESRQGTYDAYGTNRTNSAKDDEWIPPHIDVSGM